MSDLRALRRHAEPSPRPGEFVLYWMQATFRVHDNYALDHAVTEADRLGLPVVVYQGLRRDYPWASARHHTFLLEGVADVRGDLDALGVPYVFAMEEPPAEGAPPAPSQLLALAERAALVVTDYVPTELAERQIRGFRKRSSAPLVPVDSATIIPLRALPKAYATARAIRPVLLEALPTFLDDVPLLRAPRAWRPVALPPSTTGDVPDLVRRAGVDPTVPPSRSFRGGTRAGRARLDRFLAHGLPRYAEQRADPNADAVSRLSPYLHFGHVSAHEVIRVVRPVGGENAEKFIDEAVVWRELCHNFCFHDTTWPTPRAIPPWAAAELARHEGDPRDASYDLATLEAAATDEPLWNAAMNQYRVEGWMHGYLRMLWGKALIRWTPDARTAFHLLVALNNRWALDGRDPNSHGGIHWIFGRFDRPFYRHPCYGGVRYMSLRAAAGKFDVRALLREWAPR